MYTSYADFEEERKYAFRETKQWFQISNQVSYDSRFNMKRLGRGVKDPQHKIAPSPGPVRYQKALFSVHFGDSDVSVKFATLWWWPICDAGDQIIQSFLMYWIAPRILQSATSVSNLSPTFVTNIDVTGSVVNALNFAFPMNSGYSRFICNVVNLAFGWIQRQTKHCRMTNLDKQIEFRI